MPIKIVHASIGETGKVSGNAKGDSTGKEVTVRNWYDKGWDICLRHPNEGISSQASNIGTLLANSNLVGYDQPDRNSLHSVLKKNNYNIPDYLASKVLTEVDCSSFITCCYIAAGVKTLEYNSNAPTTRTMEKVFKDAGFTVLRDKKYLRSDEYLKKGDVLVKIGSHTVMACESGSRSRGNLDIDYYPKYIGDTDSIVTALAVVGVKDVSKSFRRKIYEANNLPGEYTGTASQNLKLLTLLKSGYLVKV